MYYFSQIITNIPSKFITLYFSPSQPTGKFDEFMNNLELYLEEVEKENPVQTVVWKLLVVSYASCFFLRC